MINAFTSGFLLGFSLILAIGAQNAFVLKQGLKKQHVFLVCLTCALSDALLISLGVMGFNHVITVVPGIADVARYGGAAFLFIYALKSFISAFTAEEQLSPSEETQTSAYKILLICLALTWLNPHVYLDTLLLLGSISTQFSGAKQYFAFGAVLASFTFFFSLGYGAKILIPFFKRPIAWKVLDFIIGVIMLTIACTLVL